MSRTGGEKLLNTSDLEINPATEEGLQEIVTALDDVTISEIKGKVSTANSSTTPLAIDSVFTGTSEDISNYAAVNIAVLTDQSSATDGLSLEWSQDGTNWDEKLAINITANEIFSYEFGIRARYFRVVYTNGGVAQGSFRLQIMFHPLRTRLGARALNENLDPEEFAPTRRSVLAAKKPNGTYENIHSTAGANLKVSVEESEVNFPIGTGTNSTRTLTNANTAYSVPTTAPTKNYVLILYNGSDTDMFVGYQNTNANGIELPSGGRMSFDMGVSQQVFVYCASAGKVLTYILKELN